MGRSERKAEKAELRRRAKEERAEAKRMRDKAREAARAANEASVSQAVAHQDRTAAGEQERHRKARAGARSVYDAIGFTRMYADGTCMVEPGLYSASCELEDTDLLSMPDETQAYMVAKQRELLRSLTASTTLQFSIFNRTYDPAARQFFDVPADNPLAGFAASLDDALRAADRRRASQVARSIYLTWTARAADPVAAAEELDVFWRQIQSYARGMGTTARRLDGRQRLEAINAVTRPGRPLDFDYADLQPGVPLTAKDAVCPMALDFRPAHFNSSVFTSDGTWCEVLAMEAIAEDPTVACVDAVTSTPVPLAFTWHVVPLDRDRALDRLALADVALSHDIGKEQQVSFQSGRDIDLAAPEKIRRLGELRELAAEVRRDTQGCPLALVAAAMVWAPDPETLQANSTEVSRAAKARGITLEKVKLEQREAFNTVLPVGNCHLSALLGRRTFTAARAAALIPFSNPKLDHGTGICWGKNLRTADAVVVDRRLGSNGHMNVSGKSGSGKSFFIKRDMASHILESLPKGEAGDQVIYIDPSATAEGSALFERLAPAGAAVARIGPGCPDSINPLHLADGKGWDDPEASGWLTSAVNAELVSAATSASSTLEWAGQGLVSTSLADAFARAQARGGQPLFSDLVESIRRQRTAMALELAETLRQYTMGAKAFVNRQTSSVFRPPSQGGAKHLCINLSAVPDDMKAFMMMAALEWVRSRTMLNWRAGVGTWLYVDEVQSLCDHVKVMGHLSRFMRENRKYGQRITTATQSPWMLTATDASTGNVACDIIEQCEYQVYFRGESTYVNWLDARLGLTDSEREFFSGGLGDQGMGLIVAPGRRVLFDGRLPQSGPVWDVFNTSTDEG